MQITRPSRTTFQVEGGSGDRAWHIQYGTIVNTSSLIDLSSPGTTAYFSHWNWLRRVDVEKGLVTGRWRMPGYRISAMQWKDNHIQVEIEDQDQGRLFHRTIDFDPEAPKMLDWPTTSLAGANLDQIEILCCGERGASKDQAERWLDESENAARRDPLSPFLKVGLAHAYLALGRPSEMLLDEAARTASTDFRELLHLSTALDNDGRTEAARDVFERGYAEFWRQGYDPRMVAPLHGRLVFYQPPRVEENYRPTIVDRTYRMGPFVEGADQAWETYANYLRTNGKTQEAALWERRAREARQNSIYPTPRSFGSRMDIAVYLTVAAVLASIVLFAAFFLRYLPHRRMQSRNREAPAQTERFGFFNTEYWSTEERISFLSLALIAWLASGIAGETAVLALRLAATPLGAMMGTLAGPVAAAHIETDLPASNERDLLLAIAYQQDRQLDKAERLYRQLPQFAESWNNLGVILNESGRIMDAQGAFQEAFRLNPNIKEARLNLGGDPPNFWTDQHRKYVPNRAMIAPPSPDHWLSAYGDRDLLDWTVKAIEGPFSVWNVRENVGPVYARLTPSITILVLSVIALVAYFKPRRDVTQTPYRFQKLLELALPGVAPEWRPFGGLALLGWSLLILWSIVQLTRFRSPFSFAVSPQSMERLFGVPNLPTPQNASMIYAGIGLILLYAFNAGLIWRSRRRA